MLRTVTPVSHILVPFRRLCCHVLSNSFLNLMAVSVLVLAVVPVV